MRGFMPLNNESPFEIRAKLSKQSINTTVEQKFIFAECEILVHGFNKHK